MKMKNHLLLLLMLSFGQVFCQNGMPKWVFPQASNSTNTSKVLDISSNTLSSLPQGPHFLDYQGQVPNYAYTSFTDSNGDLLFFMIDNTVYDKDGYIMVHMTDVAITNDPIQLGSNQGPGPYTPLSSDVRLGSNITVVNVPGECDKYYIMFYNEHEDVFLGLSEYSRGFYYLTIDMNLPSIYHPNRYGRLTPFHEEPITILPPTSPLDYHNIFHNAARPIRLATSAVGNGPEKFDGHNISVTNQVNGERFLYLSGKTNVEKFRITSQGFVNDGYDLSQYFTATVPNPSSPFDLFKGSGGNSNFTDADIVRLQSGDYLLAVPLYGRTSSPFRDPIDFPGWYDVPAGKQVTVVNFLIDKNTGEFNSHTAIRTLQNSNTEAFIKGVEYSVNGQYLYLAVEDNNSLYSVDLNGSPTNGYLDAVPMSLSGKANFKNGNIERSFNNKLIFTSSNGLGILDDSNNPNSNWNSSAHSFDIPERESASPISEAKGFAIPQNLNNEDYDHTNLLSNFSINIGSGPFCEGEEITATIIGGTPTPSGTWSTGQTGSSTSYTVRQGSNTLIFNAINEFGCSETIIRTFDAGPYFELELSANQYEICPKQGSTVLSYEAYFQDSRNEVEGVVWRRNGDVVSYSFGPLTVTEPGVYCVEVFDLVSGCPKEACVTIVEGPCQNLNPLFNYSKNVGQTTFTVNVTALDTRTCFTQQWYVKDITNGMYSSNWVLQGYFASGMLTNTTFYVGRTYLVLHGMWSDCQGWTATTRTVSAIDRKKGSNSIDDSEAEQPVFYPNPTSNNFQLNGFEENIQVTLMDITGKVVLQEEVINNTRIDVSALPKGVYILQANDNYNHTIYDKLMVE